MHRSSVHTAGQDLSCFHSCSLVYSSFHHECPVRSRLMFLKDLIPVISCSGGKISIFCFITFPPCNLHHGHLFISSARFHSQIIHASFLLWNKQSPGLWLWSSRWLYMIYSLAKWHLWLNIGNLDSPRTYLIPAPSLPHVYQTPSSKKGCKLSIIFL